MKKVIVSTTINSPTEAILKFDALSDWKLIVIGDLKTPADYKLKNGLYLGPREQEQYDRKLSDAIGWNCIQRRNLGFLIAYEMGADIIATIDDDNIPLDGWGTDVFVGTDVEVNYYQTDLDAFDPIGCTKYPKLWHRGYPLELLPKRNYDNKIRKTVHVDVQADFWNGDPDIDAICRMEHDPCCEFDPDTFPLSSNKPSPFNSQNTFLGRDILQDYFLIPYVGRMDDIWASYYVQSKNYKVIYGRPSVVQKRNVHDAVIDMKAEYAGYENNLNLIKDVAHDPESIKKYLPGRAIHAWDCYRRHFSVRHGDTHRGPKAPPVPVN